MDNADFTPLKNLEMDRKHLAEDLDRTNGRIERLAEQLDDAKGSRARTIKQMDAFDMTIAVLKAMEGKAEKIASPPASSEIPRRCYVDRMTTVELAIRDAIIVVEKVGAHPMLTDAVVMLSQAQVKVADYVDAFGKLPKYGDRVVELGEENDKGRVEGVKGSRVDVSWEFERDHKACVGRVVYPLSDLTWSEMDKAWTIPHSVSPKRGGLSRAMAPTES